MDGIFFEFPLCTLQLISEKHQLDNIISWCIINHLDKLNTGNIHAKFKDSQSYFNITCPRYELTLEKHDSLNYKIEEFISKYGKDSYCRIGKNLLFEVRDGQFAFKQFLVLCAISSILGKRKKFVRITYERIRYAMHGFRSKDLFYKLMPNNVELLSDKQLKRIIDILHSKKFFAKFTYQRRQIYFSTRLEDEQLRDAVKNSKIYWKKKQLQLIDRSVSMEIKTELDNLTLQSVSIAKQKQLNDSRLKLVRIKRYANN